MRSKIQWAIVGLAFAVSPVVSALAADADVTGRVLFDGKPPAEKKIAPGADAHCQKMHEKKPLLKEDMPIVSKEGGLKNVFVQVKSGLPAGQKFPVPANPVTLNQEGCHYIPHVFGIMAGQKLKVVNSDSTNHNIHGMPKANKEFNFSQSQKGMEKEVDLPKPEAFGIKCDVHNWMNARCFVMEHPFFAVTDDDGKFTIKDLPPGEYELEFIHEVPTLGSQTVKIKVEADKPTTVEDVKFKEKKKAAPKKDQKDKEDK